MIGQVQAGSLVCFCDIQDKVRPLGFEIGGKEFWLRPAENAEMDKLSLFCPVDMTHDAKKGSDWVFVWVICHIHSLLVEEL